LCVVAQAARVVVPEPAQQRALRPDLEQLVDLLLVLDDREGDVGVDDREDELGRGGILVQRDRHRAERLRRDHGVPVYVHTGDAQRAMGTGKGTGKADAFGLAAFGFIGYSLRKGGLRVTYLTSVEEVHDGDVLDLPGAPRIIGLPGHSAGSIAIHSPAVDAVFVGDGLTTRHVLTGAVGPAPAPFTDEPEQALASLAKLPQATWVLPGHGAPFSGGTAEAVARVTA